MNERLECTPSLRYKLKHTICSCFKHHPADYDHLHDESQSPPTSHHRLTRTSSAGGMTSSKSEEFLNLKHKCRTLMSRMGNTTPRGGNKYHRKSQSTDFRYDPLSYALNFEDDDALMDAYPYLNFSARLPRSPPRGPLSVVPPSRSISDGALDKAATSSSSHDDEISASPPHHDFSSVDADHCIQLIL